MTIYSFADADVDRTVKRVMREYRPGLADAGVIVQALFAMPSSDANGESSGPALTKHGYACCALVKILDLKGRLTRSSDVELLISRDDWEVMTTEQRNAAVDHQLAYLELRIDDDGQVLRDSLSRPRLALRKADRLYEWFDEVAARHGQHSLETTQAASFYHDVGQMYLPGFEVHA